MRHETVELFIIASQMQYIFSFDVISMMTAVFDMIKKAVKKKKKKLVEINLLCNSTFPRNPTPKFLEEGLGKAIFQDSRMRKSQSSPLDILNQANY